MTTEKGYIYIPNFMIIINYLYKNGQSKLNDIHTQTQITYSHVYNIKKEFFKKNIIIEEKIDKKLYLRLTDKGKELAIYIEKLFKNLDFSDDDLIKRRKVSGRKIKEMEYTTEEDDVEDKSIEEDIEEQKDEVEDVEETKEDIAEEKEQVEDVEDDSEDIEEQIKELEKEFEKRTEDVETTEEPIEEIVEDIVEDMEEEK